MSSTPTTAITLPLLAACALAIGGCDRDRRPPRAPAPTKPERAPHRGPMLNVPYPIAEAERVEGIGRAALRDAKFVYLDLAEAKPSEQIAPPRGLDANGPVVVSHHVERGHPAFWALWRLPFEGPGHTVPLPLSADEIAEFGLSAPAPTIWVVGRRGSCRGTTTAPVAQRDPSGRERVTVGYRLEGCNGSAWAPIGIVASALPIDFRWAPAATVVDESVIPGQGWKHPLAEHIEWPRWAEGSDPALNLVRVREIPEADPRVVQLRIASLDALPSGDERPWCDRTVAWSLVDGWYNERWIDPIVWHREAIAPYLLGAFVNGTQVDAVIYDDALDGLVVIPPGPLDELDDPDAWTQVFVASGQHDDEALASWAQQSIDGGLPPGPACR